MLSATERMVAAWGIETVNLRDVGRDAGQLNNSVIQYHFGTKEALVDAVLDRRLPELITEHRRRLTDLPLLPPDQRLTGLARAVVDPLADLAASDSDRPVIGFIAAIVCARHWQHFLVDRADFQEALCEISNGAVSIGTPINPAPFRTRFAWTSVVHALSTSESEVDVRVRSALVQNVTGVFSYPELAQ